MVMLLFLLVLIFCGESFGLVGHIIPHSHDDVGWLLTIDEYYDLLVQHIYNEAVQALTDDPKRRFIAVEIAYFSKWWDETATPQQQAQARAIVANGQMEFVLGGWTMEDEACTTYSTNIDQMTEGHRWIYDRFGVVPRFGWQIDPFGASNVVHEHFADMGFDGTVIDRIFYEEKQAMGAKKQMEFIWRPSKSRPELEIFTHTMLNKYTTPVDGLDWSKASFPVDRYNIQSLSESLVNYIKSVSGNFATDQILFPWGGDFDHAIAQWDFYNMDQILAYINANTSYGVTVRYSTLKEYFGALHAKNFTWPTLNATDFFPYADFPGNWWTGYFTSRVASKWWIRTREHLLKCAEMLNVAAMPSPNRSNTDGNLPKLRKLRTALGEATHHDAVSGTSEPWVVEMYNDHLQQGTDAVTSVLQDSVKALLGIGGNVSLDPTSLKNLSPTTPVYLNLYNPLGWNVQRFVSLPCFKSSGIVVYDSNGTQVTSEIIPSVASVPQPCQSANTCGYGYPAPYQIFFLANLPPAGYRTYKLTVQSKATDNTRVKKRLSDSSIENQFLKLDFDPSTGLLRAITQKSTNLKLNISQNFFYYNATWTLSRHGSVNGGAYLFSPTGPAAPVVKTAQLSSLNGNFVKTIYQDFVQENCLDPWEQIVCGVSQYFRLYNSGIEEIDNVIEISSNVGPLGWNTDFVTRFTTDLKTKGTVYTDNNCFNVHKRDFNAQLPLQANFYPVTCAAYMKDDQNQLTILVDRTRSGGSLQSGQLEIMLHRRVLTDDEKGPLDLDDTDRIENMKSLLIFDNINGSTIKRKILQYALNFPELVFFSLHSPAVPAFSALKKPLPRNIHYLTLSMVNSTVLLFRLAHIYEVGDGSLAAPVTLDITNYLNISRISNIVETSLSSVLPKDQMNRWKWNSDDEILSAPSENLRLGLITIRPGEIKTFLLYL